MRTSKMFHIVESNLSLIENQIEKGNKEAVLMGQLYNKNLDDMNRLNLTLFEGAILIWYEKNRGVPV